jgi:hypothetical protein
MESVSLNSLWIIIGIIMTSGGAVVSAFKIIGAAKDRISKLEGRVYSYYTNRNASNINWFRRPEWVAGRITRIKNRTAGISE